MSAIDALPIIVPFFGAILLLGTSGLCCIKRQFETKYIEFGERILHIEKQLRILQQETSMHEPQNIPNYTYTVPVNYQQSPYVQPAMVPQLYQNPNVYHYNQDPINPSNYRV